MLSNWASYLLGYGSAQHQQNVPSEKEGELRLTLLETEDEDSSDWIVVDKLDEEENVPPLRPKSETPPPYSAIMDESWYLTPPPVFTSLGPSSPIESSPLEDLLIEHPSMSVYCRNIDVSKTDNIKNRSLTPPIIIRTRSQTPVDTVTMVNSTNITDNNNGINEREAQRPVLQPIIPIERSIRRNQRTIQAVKQGNQTQFFITQKEVLKKAGDTLKMSHLERNNKAREVSGRNHRQRRSERQKRHSGANNNRKCY